MIAMLLLYLMSCALAFVLVAVTQKFGWLNLFPTFVSAVLCCLIWPGVLAWLILGQIIMRWPAFFEKLDAWWNRPWFKDAPPPEQ